MSLKNLKSKEKSAALVGHEEWEKATARDICTREAHLVLRDSFQCMAKSVVFSEHHRLCPHFNNYLTS